MKKLKIILIIFAAGLSAAPATGQNFTLSDAGLMSLDWILGNRTAILLEKTNVPGLGVRFVIEYQGNEPQDQGFYYVSHEDYGAGLLTELDVSMYDYYQLKFTLLSIYSDTTPDPGAVLGVGAVIGPYDDHSSAYDPEGLDFDPSPDYGTTAISSTPVRLDNTPSLLGFVAYLPWLDQWSPSGTTVTILVEAVPGAVALPKFPAIYYVDSDAPPSGDGSSWAAAFNDLQDALVVAESGDEIRVAQGAYTPEGSLLDIRRPSNPNPADGETGVSRTADLSWTAGSDATSHDVYFGTTSPGIFQGNQTATTFEPGTMDYYTTYYWRIDEVSNGGKTTGRVWSFTTVGAGPGSLPPPPDLSVPPPPLDRTATFQLKNGVVIKGGYAGCGEPNADARDIKVYETILSGDLEGNDGPNFTNNDENSYHVVTGSGCDETAILEGFTITGGNAYYASHYQGGGMFNNYSSPTVANCTFSGNLSVDGGGMGNINSSPIVTNCTFTGNWAEIGGGMCNLDGSNPTLTDCTFIGNSVGHEGGGGGGGIQNIASSPTLTNCKLMGNFAGWGGGGILNSDGSRPTLTNCVFSENQTIGWGGGMVNINSRPMMNNCTFSRNVSISFGGGGLSSFDGSSSSLTNCIVWGNAADFDSQIHNYTSSVTITYSDIQGGWPGIGNIDVDPCFVQPGYSAPISYWKFDEASGTTAYDSVGQNHGTVYGAQWTAGQISGALSFDGVNDYVEVSDDSSLRFSQYDSFSISLWAKPVLGGFLFSKMRAFAQYGVFGYELRWIGLYKFELVIEKSGAANVFAGTSNNSAPPDRWYHVTTVYDNKDMKIYLDGELRGTNFFNYDTGNTTPDKNLAIGVRSYDSTLQWYFNGNIDEFAIYNRALSADEIQQDYLNGLNGQAYPEDIKPDYHLLPDSPCINTGDPDYIAGPNETDLDGKPRIIGGRIDMGAYEFNHIPIADAGPDQTVEAQAPWGATVTLDGSGSSDADSTPGTIDDINDFNWYELDPCDPNADVFLGSGQIIDCNLSIGEHIILLEVIDRIGAFDTKEVTITVQDTTPPDINCPPDVILECPADTTPSETGNATATDTCGNVTITHSDQWQPNCGNAGTLARTWTATDESGNSSTCLQIITVVDTTPPVITCPADVTLECPADTSVEANGSATGGDTCGTVTITHSDQWQPGCGNTGILTRTWTATDECGNSSSCLQTLTVVDTTPPEFEFSVAPTMLWPPSHMMVEVTPSWTVSDECDATPEVSLVGIVANEGDDTIGDGHTSNDIQIGEDGSIYLRSERSGTSDDRVYTITYQAVDDCGNATVRSATVSIPHDFKVLARIAARWLWAGPGRIPEDLNGDGVVNLKDIAIFANNWIK